MPGSARWQIHTVKEANNCWVCDKWQYTLYFWNQKIGNYNDNNTIGIER